MALVTSVLSWGHRQAIHRNALRATFTFGKSGVFACWGCPPNPQESGLLKGLISQESSGLFAYLLGAERRSSYSE
ncbi:hypothetical protein [Nostoc sp. WHI]|uniref:hypothetical protein n=1 Tax=Nostoc sp. WHI TaxID=2650611 RepID=UPI0018C7B48C|nr:hypothetical protein [Nostoc sp. WHI]